MVVREILFSLRRLTKWLMRKFIRLTGMGGARLFLLGGKGARQGAGHVGADISHGRALGERMDDNWGGGGSWGGQSQGTGGTAVLLLAPPMLTGLALLDIQRNICRLISTEAAFDRFDKTEKRPRLRTVMERCHVIILLLACINCQ